MPAPAMPQPDTRPTRPHPARPVAALLVALALIACVPPAVAGQPQAGSPPPADTTAPRSRLYVVVPGYEAYLAPAAAAAAPPPRPGAPAAPAAPVIAAPEVPAPAIAAPDVPTPAIPAPAAPSDDRAGDAPLLTIAFAGADTALPRQAEPPLAAVALELARRPTMVIALAGFADAAAGDAVNARRRALWRARAVRTRLLEAGVAADRVRVAAAASADGRAMERVDVRIVQP